MLVLSGGVRRRCKVQEYGMTGSGHYLFLLIASQITSEQNGALRWLLGLAS